MVEKEAYPKIERRKPKKKSAYPKIENEEEKSAKSELLEVKKPQ